MPVWTFYPAFAGAIISMIALTRIAWHEHDRDQPRTLSELAAAEARLLKQFRNVLWLCGSLFAITAYWFIVPRINHAPWVIFAWSLTFAPEMLLARIPERGKTRRLHDLLAEAMGAGMLLLAFVFWRNLHGTYADGELAIALVMSALAVLTVLDRRRFIFYELPFIYWSHFSLLVAALALRNV